MSPLQNHAMHFVKKVPTSDEEKAVKEKERAVKLRAFCGLRDRIFDKRRKEGHDDELMELTEKLLRKNPDIYTFWNIRREALERKREQSPDTVEDAYARELAVTYECIEANPKSYSAWFQRGWILERQAAPDLKKELSHCELALKADCRNFHAWDHRRVVARMAKLTEQEELEFSQKLVANNFSNFSAWHMRMHLLPREVDAVTGESVLPEAIAKDEIKRVANAVFTDPEDQSAWVFARWLISLYSPSSFLNEESSLPNRPLAVSLLNGRLIVAMCRSCTSEVVASFVRGDVTASLKPVSRFGDSSSVAARVWATDVDEAVDSVEASLDGDSWTSVTPSKPLVDIARYKSIFLCCPRPQIDAIRAHCDELLQEETANAMALLTRTECLRATAPIESHADIVATLEKLADTVDPLRANMYKSYISQERFRRNLARNEEHSSQSHPSRLDELVSGSVSRLAVRYKDVHEFLHLDLLAPFIDHIDLRGNESLVDATPLSVLAGASTLGLDETGITRLPPSLSSLSRIDMLSCGGCTGLVALEGVLPMLKELPKGGERPPRFLFCETPLVEKSEELHEALGDAVRLIPYYL